MSARKDAELSSPAKRWRRLFVASVGLVLVAGAPAMIAQASPSPGIVTGSAATSLDEPPQDDPDAVAEYLELLAAYRAANASVRATAAAAATGPCLSSVSYKSVSQGTTVSVYRKTGAPFLVCTNAAQSVYDNEYKPLVKNLYEGQKWRDQLVCHIANAWDKRPWNLDSWRPNVGYNATVAAQCNP